MLHPERLTHMYNTTRHDKTCIPPSSGHTHTPRTHVRATSQSRSTPHDTASKGVQESQCIAALHLKTVSKSVTRGPNTGWRLKHTLSATLIYTLTCCVHNTPPPARHTPAHTLGLLSSSETCAVTQPPVCVPTQTHNKNSSLQHQQQPVTPALPQAR